MNIRQKVLLFVLLLALVPILLAGLGIGYFSISQSQKSLEAAAENSVIASTTIRLFALDVISSSSPSK